MKSINACIWGVAMTQWYIICLDAEDHNFRPQHFQLKGSGNSVTVYKISCVCEARRIFYMGRCRSYVVSIVRLMIPSPDWLIFSFEATSSLVVHYTQ